MPCGIYLFILRTDKLQALAWQEGEEFFVLFLAWGRGGWEGVCGSFSDLELKENALINPGDRWDEGVKNCSFKIQ